MGFVGALPRVARNRVRPTLSRPDPADRLAGVGRAHLPLGVPLRPHARGDHTEAAEAAPRRVGGGAGGGGRGGVASEEILGTVRAVAKLLEAPNAEETLLNSALCPPPRGKAPCTIAIRVERSSVFVRGLYRKLSRSLPQTAWLIDGQRKAASSVQELIEGPLLRAFRASRAKFSSAGREDVDVRMLGDGRPFVLELLDSRAHPDAAAKAFKALTVEICQCGLVQVSRLALCDGELPTN